MIRILDDRKQKMYRIPIEDVNTSEAKRLMADIAALPAASRVWSTAEREWQINYTQKRGVRAIYMRHRPVESGIQVAPDFSRPLKPQQAAALRFCQAEPSALLDMYMSTGKTRTAIELIPLKQAARIFIVCPTAAMSVWRDQIPEWAAYRYGLLVLARGMPIKKRAAELERFLEQDASAERPLIAVCNYEAAWREPLNRVIEAGVWDMIIADECHRLGSPGSKVSRFFGKLAVNAPFRYGLSGTPLRTSILDAYALYRFLHPMLFGRNYSHFQREYAEIDHVTRRVIAYKNIDQFRERYNIIRFHAGRETLQIDEPLMNLLPVRLTRSTWMTYKDVERDFYAELESGGVIDAPNVLVKYLRLQQLESEFVTLDDGSLARLTSGATAKQQVLRDFLEDFAKDEKLVIFTRFQLETTMALEEVKRSERRVFQLTGARKELAEWGVDPTGAVLVVSLGAGAEGIDLTAATYAIFWSLSYKLTEFEQAVSRVNRINQRQAPVIYVMTPEGPSGEISIGRKVYQAHIAKRSLLDELTQQKKDTVNAANNDY